MEYDVLLPPPARRDFRKLPPEVQPRIRRALRSLKNPRSVDAKKLSDSKNRWRIREGDYRIIYQVNHAEKQVVVLSIAHRREAYGR